MHTQMELDFGLLLGKIATEGFLHPQC